ncbi:hypothetical protein ABZ618_19150 [Streptomyces roseolus]|uniref:hypothetical protein n=1 Tax=Streptomyces roseolus TaxID=67358 RepID=UPI00340788E5
MSVTPTATATATATAATSPAASTAQRPANEHSRIAGDAPGSTACCAGPPGTQGRPGADLGPALLDIESWGPETYRKVTGRPLKPTLDFARRLAELGQDVHVRFVLVPGLTDDPADVEGVTAFAGGLGNVSRVDVLPFRKRGEAKWQALGMPFTLHDTPSPAPERVAAVREVFRSHGLQAV